jgi:hypothetical protein
VELIFIKAHETGRLSLTFAVDAPDGRMIVSAHYLPTENVAVGTATIDCVKDSARGFIYYAYDAVKAIEKAMGFDVDACDPFPQSIRVSFPVDKYVALFNRLIQEQKEFVIMNRMDTIREENTLLRTILAGILPCPVSDAIVDARTHESRTDGVSGPFDWGRTVGRDMVVATQLQEGK